MLGAALLPSLKPAMTKLIYKCAGPVMTLDFFCLWGACRMLLSRSCGVPCAAQACKLWHVSCCCTSWALHRSSSWCKECCRRGFIEGYPKLRLLLAQGPPQGLGVFSSSERGSASGMLRFW